MSKDETKANNVESLDIARNKKRSKEGRLRNLASMFVAREIERGPFYANMWLYTEFERQGVDDLNKAFKELEPYVFEVRKEMYL